jgi:hypothetical protein
VPHQVTWANEGIKLLNSALVDTELKQYDAKTGKPQDPPVDTASSQSTLKSTEVIKVLEEAQFSMTE